MNKAEGKVRYVDGSHLNIDIPRWYAIAETIGVLKDNVAYMSVICARALIISIFWPHSGGVFIFMNQSGCLCLYTNNQMALVCYRFSRRDANSWILLNSAVNGSADLLLRIFSCRTFIRNPAAIKIVDERPVECRLLFAARNCKSCIILSFKNSPSSRTGLDCIQQGCRYKGNRSGAPTWVGWVNSRINVWSNPCKADYRIPPSTISTHNPLWARRKGMCIYKMGFKIQNNNY